MLLSAHDSWRQAGAYGVGAGIPVWDVAFQIIPIDQDTFGIKACVSFVQTLVCFPGFLEQAETDACSMAHRVAPTSCKKTSWNRA